MPMNVDKLKNMNADPRMVDKIRRNSTMVAEQGGFENFLSEYGGSSQYIQFAKMPESSRLVYASVLDGYTQTDQIAVATGLDEKEVKKVINKLRSDGLIDKQEQITPIL